MQPHQPANDHPDPPPHPPRRGDQRPMDPDWLQERALRYAARWEASSSGVQTLLERKVRERCERTGESPEEILGQIPRIVSELVDNGYVDDRRFATEALDRLRRQGRSTRQIRARLLARGIPEDLLDELFEAEDPGIELVSAWRFARRRRLGPYCQDPQDRQMARERHLAALGRQGFDLETALEVVDAETAREFR
ncbi:MAG TPA: hypothetical protein ENI85_05265 [Deltaproteobacteria bacterium]|nr:hypothetical protein [Deltaproteobacteria bacterium]